MNARHSETLGRAVIVLLSCVAIVVLLSMWGGR